jgi:hypothetical protein
VDRFKFVLVTGIVSLGVLGARAATHHPEVNIPPFYLVSPAFQDLSVPIKIYKTIYEDFTPIYTTTTVQLSQDFRGKLAGTASFASSRSEDSHSFDISGKLKIKKNVVTFSAKGTDDGDSSISLTAAVTGFEYPLAELLADSASADKTIAKQTTNPAELVSRSTILFDIRVKGTTRPYKFAQEAQTTGASYIIIGLPDKKDSDYYQLSAPWGTALATGNTQVFGPLVIFTLKASKFAAVLTDLDATGGFVPESYSLKIGSGKYIGLVESDEP